MCAETTANSEHPRSGIKLTMGFLFSIVAALLVGDYLGAAVNLTQSAFSTTHVLYLVGCGAFLMRTVFDCYIYYEVGEGYPVGWARYWGAVFLSILELIVLYWCYDFVHNTIPSAPFGQEQILNFSLLARFVRDLALVESTWLLWDFTYLSVVRRPTSNEHAASWLIRIQRSSDPVVRATGRWTILNLAWAVAFWVFWLGVPDSPAPVTILWAGVACFLILMCVGSYLVWMKDYYCGHLYGLH
jgi:drug/metabolite transporter (DMT)-like permease